MLSEGGGGHILLKYFIIDVVHIIYFYSLCCTECCGADPFSLEGEGGKHLDGQLLCQWLIQLFTKGHIYLSPTLIRLVSLVGWLVSRFQAGGGGGFTTKKIILKLCG